MITNTPSTHRGENARVQLLCSAADVYGELGLDGATTRKIAQVSGQNIAAISYYFGSKEGLYLAVAQLIANTIKENFSETTAEIDTYLRQTNPPPDEAIKLLQKALGLS